MTIYQKQEEAPRRGSVCGKCGGAYEECRCDRHPVYCEHMLRRDICEECPVTTTGGSEMRVRIGSSVWDASATPIMLILSEQDKRNIVAAHQEDGPAFTRYICAPATMAEQEVNAWIGEELCVERIAEPGKMETQAAGAKRVAECEPPHHRIARDDREAIAEARDVIAKLAASTLQLQELIYAAIEAEKAGAIGSSRLRAAVRAFKEPDGA